MAGHKESGHSECRETTVTEITGQGILLCNGKTGTSYLTGDLHVSIKHGPCPIQVPNYDTIENNPICLRLPWEYDPEMFSRWKEGRTGYPWIDAAMRQLHKEGWIHHCLRYSPAIKPVFSLSLRSVLIHALQ